MANLTPLEYAKIRRGIEVGQVDSPLSKPEMDGVIQAIEDAFEAFRPTLVSAIDAAAPRTIPGALKKKLVAYWLNHKFGVETV